MSPTIRVWGISGPLGMIVSGLITIVMISLGAFSLQGTDVTCTAGLGDCIGQLIGSAIGELLVLFLLVGLVFLLFVIAAWFLTGLFAGWQVVRHIRRLEPGITNRQGWRVAAGWGCGAVMAALVMFALMSMLTIRLGL